MSDSAPFRIGVTNVEQVIRIGPHGAEELYHATVDCFVEQPDVHTADFEAVVNDVIGEVAQRALKVERLAERVARELRERRRAQRAEVTVAARYPQHKPAPVSGI